MIKIIKKFILQFVPGRINRQYFIFKESIKYRLLKNDILKYYQKRSANSLSAEELEVINYLKKNTIAIFPYQFVKGYSFSKIKVHKDKQNGLPYLFHDNKKLYFKRSWSKDDVRASYYGLQVEQDVKSPHRYLTPAFSVSEGDVLIDAGSAEGILALSVIEKVQKVYLFETDAEWIEALNATFAPWKEKVQIVNKFVANQNDDKHISLNTMFGENDKVDFVKIDVDGAESELLAGATNLLNRRKGIKIALCTYHQQDDAAVFSKLLSDNSFDIEFSNGYMLFYRDKNMTAPYFRRGLIRATKK